ncbi:divergent PAP2 family protein [Salipaludibacillus agaradhaerens]|jgi:acid phosphatase family membrane protein YuiD|uniref:Divergent PAP2 family protein n=1 Tax=Salipaludibacillus agaradhaerens TaxID=76935 RepID=A0A9Q4AZJ4_SALAG|nr:divergent PAP2 family protein [Salipaludibacillus agaradhaerens]UJW59820.1 divergent PAP2 family protein [Bacillus sp. A116_S68]MCR6095275.1 divergent PAP2 family protein [Salipaludibacillus agaradhaerens]MCR6107821.1 divergent PAP2 family protein [Salipaludibacillus agaradhaerens]MCR6115167.1 divergent PAP2 family protein [Salipaludibacillus agaradhaerens]MCR6119850.1 divergent PAP2 family protein [Salipaludibacillus agaradhaerens]
MELFYNFPLWTALFTIGFAQFIKVPLNFIATKQFEWSLLTSTGGMPSSHSGAVTAVATAIGLQHGFDSPFFAISAIFGIIVMFDATGVRRHAGEQATVINRLVTDFNKAIAEMKHWPQKEEQEKRKELKELLGHQPIEVFFGGLLGIIIALIFHGILY